MALGIWDEEQPSVAVILAGTTSLSFVVYLCYLAIYRLFLSPIKQFPGPRLAALSNWYEFYYDVILHGQFTNHIRDLHKIYGKLWRIFASWLSCANSVRDAERSGQDPSSA
jgi:hypothetical protein